MVSMLGLRTALWLSVELSRARQVIAAPFLFRSVVLQIVVVCWSCVVILSRYYWLLVMRRHLSVMLLD